MATKNIKNNCSNPCKPPVPMKRNEKLIRDECKQFVLSNDQLKDLSTRFLASIKEGLSKETHDRADIKCFITYVHDLPTGKERGKFFALDLGGTNFRVIIIEIKSEDDLSMKSKIYDVPHKLLSGPGSSLMEHVADCLTAFAEENNVLNDNLPVGFTFSFPLMQYGLSKGVLVHWTKGFSCTGMVGQDVVKMLLESIDRKKKLKISMVAIVNDTTGTLMSCAWKAKDCKIGCIIGTGSNACYLEKIENAELFDEPGSNKKQVIVNCEWGAFGNHGNLEHLRTDFDREIDEKSKNRGEQIFEKMISGLYMGEIARLIIVKCTQAGYLFKGRGSTLLYTEGSFLTKYLSDIESTRKDTCTCRCILAELGLCHATEEDCQYVKYICEVISTRSAYLVAAGLSTLINKINDPTITVGLDGSVYRLHPKFKCRLDAKMRELVNTHIKFRTMLAEDGSGKGAALVVAAACGNPVAK